MDAWELNATYCECRDNIKRWSDAYDYAMGRADCYTANNIIYNLQPVAGWFPLAVIEIDAIQELAFDEDFGEWQPLGDAEELELIRDAVESVADSWDNSDNGASEVAFDRIEEIAKERGITLIPREEGGSE